MGGVLEGLNLYDTQYIASSKRGGEGVCKWPDLYICTFVQKKTNDDEMLIINGENSKYVGGIEMLCHYCNMWVRHGAGGAGTLSYEKRHNSCLQNNEMRKCKTNNAVHQIENIYT